MTVETGTPALFQPIRVGDLDLKHRIVLAPLTRFRGYDDHVPGPQAATYYSQRASMPGTLLITEATFIAAPAGGYANVPGIYTDAQIEGWKKITDNVHAKGSYIYLQLWALGRAADPKFLASEGHELVGASDIPLEDYAKAGLPAPRVLTIPEIKEYVQLYANAAQNAIKAGFDGVEIHGANGYLIDQFLQDVSNTRTDEYGGSIESRAKFALEVVDAVVNAIGAPKTGIRLSPWSKFQDMGMKDPIPTYTYYVNELRKRNLSYIHVVEPRVNGNVDVKEWTGSNDFIREIWGDRPYITAGGYTREQALKTAQEKGGLIAFGRLYISNPDLPRRLLEDIPLTKPDRTKFYLPGSHTPEGYTDWEFADVPTKARI
ncbi:NADH:flavin oxidoreductase/NADH oxidase [Coniophora puteana RWD-64-598 SS2]|uniref:NADH:flavin oxidoreductase/NADH oxidase n=1 Tax=Coniophora puteana (strain RWD-64-598) TaxID=741705 RepID=A0A5M3MGR5_CONPW|nr:NADH:flavin oxidoreductase/NADH oxidase [Coniophora puteana RWD-64-598 SS2]EIW77964.1 NADH:flavin oxidoreductase/NADH oxidase [Coniophora puteana RWD-64-598 SS2]